LQEQSKILPAEYNGPINYEPSGSPIEVNIINPDNVINGNYVLRFDQSEDIEDGSSAWELFNADSNESLGRAEQDLENITEQLFPDLGISISLGQSPDAGDLADSSNGAIGQTIGYADPAKSWLVPVPDNANFPEALSQLDLNYLANGPGQISQDLDPFQAYSNLGSRHFAPYTLMDWNTRPEVYATPAWISPTSAIVQQRNPLEEINNVDIVFTNDKSLWSRCVVVETGNVYYTDAEFPLDDDKRNFEVVDRPSVGKEDNDGDGRADEDGTGIGFAWFPGYAIDVETGIRLNVFFGENSALGDNTLVGSLLDEQNGSDMMFNPSSQAAIESYTGPDLGPPFFVLGGMHYMYVTKQPYDECEFINEKLRESLSFRRVDAFQLISWAGISLGREDVPMLSYADGLIPTETVVKLRVDNPYGVATMTGENEGYPSYRFELNCEEMTSTASPGFRDERLDKIEVYPNPFLSQTDNAVKIGNLPPSSIVSIFSVDGKLIQQFDLDHQDVNTGTTLEWDARSESGNPLPSGAYFIHVHAEGIGQRTLKWINVQ